MAIIYKDGSTVHSAGMTPENKFTDGSIDVVGTYHLADTTNLFELQRKNNFELVVYGLDNLVAAGQDEITDTNNYYSDGENILRLTCSSTSIPTFSQDPIVIRRGNNEIKYAGVPKFKDGSIKVYDTIGPDSRGLLMAWQNCSYDVRTEKVGLSTDYKKKAYLTEYTPDWQKVRTYILYGCWISSLQIDDSDWNSGDNKTVTATITYDRAILEQTDMTD